MKKKLVIGAVLLQMICCLGCSAVAESPVNSSLTIDKKGKIKSVIVEPFEEPYLQLEELQTMIDEEVTAYNQEFGSQVVMADKAYLSDQNGTVIENMTFEDYIHYAKFNDRNFFVGTIEEALQAGYEFKVALASLEEEGTTISPEQIQELTEFNILIVDEPGDYHLYGKPGFASHGVSLIGKKSVNVSEEMEGIAYILFQ